MSFLEQFSTILGESRRRTNEILSEVEKNRFSTFVEHFTSSQADRTSSTKTIDSPTVENCNRVLAGENLTWLALLVTGGLGESLQGKVDLIYLDPPFLSGADYALQVSVPAVSTETKIKFKLPAYTDTWDGLAQYLLMLAPRLMLAKKLLSERGSIYVHIDWRVNGYVRVLLDEIFGVENLRNEIAWCYTSPGRSTTRFKPCHDTIYYYTMGPQARWTRPQQELAPATRKISSLKFADQSEPWVRSRNTKDMVDWWPINFQTGSAERLGYATQKPIALLERIISASSLEGDLVLDFFAGSGTTLCAAERLGRRFIGIDSGQAAINTIRKRLVNQARQPFQIEFLSNQPGMPNNSWQVTDANQNPSVTMPQSIKAFNDAKITVKQLPDKAEVCLADYRFDLTKLARLEDPKVSSELEEIVFQDPLSMIDFWQVGYFNETGGFNSLGCQTRPTRAPKTQGTKVQPIIEIPDFGLNNGKELWVQIIDVLGDTYWMRA